MKTTQSVKSKHFSITKVIIKAEVPKKKKTYSKTNIKLINSKHSLFRQISGTPTINLSVPNSQIKVFAKNHSYFIKPHQIVLYHNYSFYDNTEAFSFHYLSSFSVRPPPAG